MRDMRSKLNEYYADDFIQKAVQYFGSLSPDAQKRISVFRLSQHLECNSFKAAAFLNRCAENGIVRKYRVLCCPYCGHVLKEVSSIADIRKTEYCPRCDKDVHRDDLDCVHDLELRYEIVEKRGEE